MKINQKPKKKGFTMIEVLVVIAIIAALIAVIIPIVNISTTKSAAATNAANLRSIEGKIEAMRILDPSGFEAYAKRGAAIRQLESHIIWHFIEAVFGETRLEEKYMSLPANAGYIDIPLSQNLRIEGIPFSKGLTAKKANDRGEVEIFADLPMEIFFSETGVFASYGGYTKEDFADIAEDGVYDGHLKVNNDIEAGLACDDWRSHAWDGCECTKCHRFAHSDSFIRYNFNSRLTDEGNCTVCGVHREHRSTGVDHSCKDPECTYEFDEQSRGACYDRNKDQKCDACGKEVDHTCLDKQHPGYFGVLEDGPDHICDYKGCNKPMGPACMSSVTAGDDDYRGSPRHVCTYCGDIEYCADTATKDHRCDKFCREETMSKCSDYPLSTYDTTDPFYATHHKCSHCSSPTEHVFVEGKCTVDGKSCGLYRHSCGYTAGGCTAVWYNKNSNDPHCSDHEYPNTCALCGDYRSATQNAGTNGCPNKANHPNCALCDKTAIMKDGSTPYCGDHQYADNCPICGSYRDGDSAPNGINNCPNKANHPNCDLCTKTAIMKDGSTPYCGDHQYADNCPICGSYRDGDSAPNGINNCPNTNHPKCAECNTAKATGTDAGEYYCSEHIKENTCDAYLTNGRQCGMTYRGSSCPNSANHADCITADTLITLADGNQKRVDQMIGDELLLVWNHETGAFDVAPVAYVIDHGKHLAEQEIIRLVFSNGTDVKIVSEHNFFDVTLNRYVPITSANAESFIGHTFVGIGADGSSLERFDLVAVERYVEETYIYDLVSYKYLNCFTNNVLSGCAYIKGLLNIYDIDSDTMAYDAEKMQQDIAEYGLMDYSVLAPYISEYVFEMHNCSALQVGMGKDVITQEEIFALIDLFYSLVP